VLDNVRVAEERAGLRWLFRDLVLHSNEEEKRAHAVLDRVGLNGFAHLYPESLSLGLQRLVGVARALAGDPHVLLLDEPASGLDTDESLKLGSQLQDIANEGTTILLVDHDMSLVMRACDFIYVLDFGRMLASGKPEEVRSNTLVISAYLGEAKEELHSDAEATDLAEIPDVWAAVSGPAGEAAGEAAHPQREPLLEVSKLAAGYGHLEVIRDVSLQVGKGEVVAVIGANGAGKTTTLRAISGMIHARRGTVRFDGQDLTGKPPQQVVRAGLMHVPQGRGLFPRLTIEETLRLAAYSGHRGGDFAPAYDTFPVLAKRRSQLAGTLSGGEQQMLALARALLVRPKLLMIDEMSQGLAPAVVQRLFGYLEVFKREGIAVLLVEQFVDSALSVADRAYVFEQGTVAVEESARRLRQDKALIASSYLGSAVEAQPQAVAANGNGKKAWLLEEMTLRLPAELKRSIQERAAREGKPADELLLEILGGGGR
jgi:ABC-type branched-subunit amino acid transport system ATPase component